MRKPNRSTPAPSAPKPAAPAPETPPAPRVRRTDVALHPSTPLECLVSRALDQELEWYFVYAETALGRESVALLPSYAVATALSSPSSDPTEDVLRGKAHELAQTVQGCLRRLADRHASVLRAIYTPRRWPKNVEAEFQVLAPIVVRLSVATDPWPARSAHAGLEDAAAARLAARLVADRPVPLERLKTQASRLFGTAVVAYTKVRALEGPALGLS
jgi:hypothetical protein